jgi:copper chaperone
MASLKVGAVETTKTTMTEFKVEAMNSGTATAVTEALRRADPDAQVEVDLTRKTVRVESSRLRADLAKDLGEAGYAPA